MARLPAKRTDRSHRKRPTTFAEVRRRAEDRLAHGLKLNFDQIMLDIDAIRKQAAKPSRN